MLFTNETQTLIGGMKSSTKIKQTIIRIFVGILVVLFDCVYSTSQRFSPVVIIFRHSYDFCDHTKACKSIEQCSICCNVYLPCSLVSVRQSVSQSFRSLSLRSRLSMICFFFQ